MGATGDRMKEHKDDIVNLWLLKIKNFLGGVTKAVRFLNEVEKLNGAEVFVITRSDFNNWLNRRSAIPYDCIIIIVCAIKINIEHFVPGNIANKTVDISAFKTPLFKTPLENIILDAPYFLRDVDEGCPIILDRNYDLISGRSRIEYYKSIGVKHIQVEIIAWDTLCLKYQSFRNTSDRFVSSKRIVFAERLNQLPKGNGGQGNNLQKNAKKDKKRIDFDLNFCRNCDKSSLVRKEEELAKLARQVWASKKIAEGSIHATI